MCQAKSGLKPSPLLRAGEKDNKGRQMLRNKSSGGEGSVKDGVRWGMEHRAAGARALLREGHGTAAQAAGRGPRSCRPWLAAVSKAAQAADRSSLSNPFMSTNSHPGRPAFILQTATRPSIRAALLYTRIKAGASRWAWSAFPAPWRRWRLPHWSTPRSLTNPVVTQPAREAPARKPAIRQQSYISFISRSTDDMPGRGEGVPHFTGMRLTAAVWCNDYPLLCMRKN